jgi:hypothetical protein
MVGPKLKTFKGRFHYKEDYPNGNEEESYQEGRQKEKEVTDPGEAKASLFFLFTTGLRRCSRRPFRFPGMATRPSVRRPFQLFVTRPVSRLGGQCRDAQHLR